jgi:hypothetical protein
VYTIKGTGNIKSIKEPAIDFPSEFDTYTPQTDVNAHVSGSNVTGTMTINYTFIPQSVGDFSIGADKFIYFNPETQKYVTLTTPEYNIKVAKGSDTPSASTGVNKQNITSKNTDILHIKTGHLNPSKEHTYIYSAWWYWWVYVVLALALVAVIAIYSKQVKMNADIQGRKLANANKVARKRLKAAKGFMDAHDNEKFYAEMLRALWGYLSDKLGIPASQLTRDNISGQLATYGAPQSLTDKFIGVIDECEMARYSPAKSDEQIEQLYRDASQAMNEMESLKRGKR